MFSVSSRRPSVVRFSQTPPRQRQLRQLAGPVEVVLGWIGVDGLTGSAVDGQVSLPVALQVVGPVGSPAGDRRPRR